MEKNARGTERTGGKNDTTLSGERNESVGTESGVVGVDTGDLSTVTLDGADVGPVGVLEV